jgi:hypothetical protein
MFPAVPPVTFWLTIEFEVEAEPEMTAEGEASVPVYTVAATLCVEIVSAVARRLAKSNVSVRTSG